MYYDSGFPDLGERNPLHLLDARHMNTDELEKFSDMLKPFFGYLQYANRGDAETYVSENQGLFRNLPTHVTDALIEVTGSEDLKRIRKECTTMEGGVNFVDDFKLMKERERKEGRKDERNKVAERMINDGMPGDKISLFTSLGRKDIDTIAQRLNRTVVWSEARA